MSFPPYVESIDNDMKTHLDYARLSIVRVEPKKANKMNES